MRLVISLATRGRPDRLIDTVTKSIVNCTDPNTIMQVQVDEDDHPTIDLCNGPKCVGLDERVQFNIKPRELTIAAKWNRALELSGDVYLVAADDDPYVIPGYDTKIIEAAKRFPDGCGMVYGHLANLSFSGAVAPTRKLCELMGNKIFPEYFPYWFCDHWTDDVARIIGRLSFANIRTDQSRPGVTQEMREPGWWATWFDAAYLMRRKQAHDIIKHPDFICPDWQKELLLTHHPLIEVRSRMINQNVRSQNAQLSQWAGNLKPDERYNRIKQRAIEMVLHLLNDYGMPDQERDMFSRALLGKPLERAA